MKKPTDEVIKNLITTAKKRWGKVADDNGWSMKGRGVIVWIDENFKTVDSLYAPHGDSENMIVNNNNTDEILYQGNKL